MTTANFAEATRHLEEARTSLQNLDEEYAKGRDRNPALISKHHNVFRQNAKLAEVEALLAIAAALEWSGIGSMPGVRGRPLSPESLEAS